MTQVRKLAPVFKLQTGQAGQIMQFLPLVMAHEKARQMGCRVRRDEAAHQAPRFRRAFTASAS